MDASRFNEYDSQWFSIGTVLGKQGNVARTIFASPYLTVTFHVLYAPATPVPTAGDLTVFGLIRDQLQDYRRVDPSVFGLKFFQDSNNGFSLQYPNGCDGIEIVSTLEDAGNAVNLLDVRARASGVPSNVRILKR